MKSFGSVKWKRGAWEIRCEPHVADVLGIKRAQALGIRDPNANLISMLQSDGQHIERLAETYLKSRSSAA
ncbi:MAG: hypothetical protein IT364_24615 [Candidatus Hydrogenedentes bacterium]|nr:hypothetical protein [Candidatus Hydrogenedentota bacterium]